MQKIALFADVQNIYYTTRQSFGRQFNYRALWERVSAQGEIVAATAYAIDRGDDQQRKFQDALRGIGFEVKLKPFIQRRDGSAKGDWDVGIAIDAMEIAPTVDTIVLLSGDGDFDLLLERVRKNYGVNAEVYSVPALTANSLIEHASNWHAIDRTLLI
ncbi:MAG: NYN domain-containing protein [Woeseia sp.]